MAKELPYFQFEPAEYLTKDISFCSLSSQGLFINLCSYYWQRECQLTKDQFLKRFKYDTEFNELLSEGVFDLDNEGNIIIKFLDNQYENATKKSAVNSVNGSKGGRPKKPKQNPIKTETKANEKRNESETKGIREDKIKEEKKKSDFDLAFIDFEKMRKIIKKPLTDRAKKMVLDKLNKLADDEPTKIKILENSIVNNWQDVYPLKENQKVDAKGNDYVIVPTGGLDYN